MRERATYRRRQSGPLGLARPWAAPVLVMPLPDLGGHGLTSPTLRILFPRTKTAIQVKATEMYTRILF